MARIILLVNLPAILAVTVTIVEPIVSRIIPSLLILARFLGV